MSVNIFNRKDTNVNEHVRLSKRTLEDSKIEENHFYCCCTFQSHSRVFNNEHNSLQLSSFTEKMGSSIRPSKRFQYLLPVYEIRRLFYILVCYVPCKQNQHS